MHLTKKQEALLSYIEEFQMKYGKSPTVREMREHFGLSSDNSIVKLVRALEQKKYIEKDTTPRGIKLLRAVQEKLERAAEVVKLPLLGEIPAGGPVISEENTLSKHVVGDIGVKKAKDSFLLRVRGDSMEDAGIFEGDIVIANSTQEPRIGDIVIALVDKANTVKRFMKDKQGRVYLQPENSKYSPIYPDENLEIQGVVTGLMREY